MTIPDSSNAIINDLLTWGSIPQANINGRFSWTGTTGQAATIKYSL